MNYALGIITVACNFTENFEDSSWNTGSSVVTLLSDNFEDASWGT